MKHFWIAFIIIIAVILLAGHGILTVWMAQVRVSKYEAQTQRLETIDFACSGIQEGRSLAFIIDGETFKCNEMRINYVPSKEKARML